MTTLKQELSEITAMARRLGLSPETVNYCLEVELVQRPLSESDLAELRRVRRLQELEVNLPGVEIILRMRQQIQAMQRQMEAMAAEMAATQSRFERELRDLERRLARDLSL
jgi:DNA-binding transcriptional MerR regulator